MSSSFSIRPSIVERCEIEEETEANGRKQEALKLLSLGNTTKQYFVESLQMPRLVITAVDERTVNHISVL